MSKSGGHTSLFMSRREFISILWSGKLEIYAKTHEKMENAPNDVLSIHVYRDPVTVWPQNRQILGPCQVFPLESQPHICRLPFEFGVQNGNIKSNKEMIFLYGFRQK